MDNVETILAGATNETIVHLDYVAMRPASETAKKEFADARDWDKRPTQYVGHFSSLRRTKRFGELVLTLWVHNRGESGGFRAFNLDSGKLRDIKRVSG